MKSFWRVSSALGEEKEMIRYINTDLELLSREDISDLIDFLKSNGMYILHNLVNESGKNDAWLELDLDSNKAQETIRLMIDVLLKMEGKARKQWELCEKKDFNIGFDCGSEPWAFNEELPDTLIKKVAEFNAGIKITIYPEKSPN